MTLIVGMPVSLSGQFQYQGHQALAGLQAWAQDSNSKFPNSFKVIHYDDASDSSTVREVTLRLIVEDHVDILIGPYSSVLTSAAAQVAEEHGKLLAATRPAVTEPFTRLVDICVRSTSTMVTMSPSLLCSLSAEPVACSRRICFVN